MHTTHCETAIVKQRCRKPVGRLIFSHTEFYGFSQNKPEFISIRTSVSLRQAKVIVSHCFGTFVKSFYMLPKASVHTLCLYLMWLCPCGSYVIGMLYVGCISSFSSFGFSRHGSPQQMFKLYLLCTVEPIQSRAQSGSLYLGWTKICLGFASNVFCPGFPSDISLL